MISPAPITPEVRSGNPAVSNTAARYVAKAMGRVAPRQRAELLRNIIEQAKAGLLVMGQ